LRVLVVGDAVLDRYWFGDVRRISPEAPVPVVRMLRVEERAGAAENVARNIKSLGGECDTLFSDSERIVKLRVIASQQQVCRVDFDHPQKPVQQDRFLKSLGDCGLVVFSDYGKGALSEVSNLIWLAKQAGKKVLVDPKGYDFEKYSGADVLKPNLDEMRSMVGGWKSEADLEVKAQRLIREAKIGALLLTRASEGMSIYTLDATHHMPAAAREVYDVTGAGDTAIAALAVFMSEGKSLEESCALANKASGIACGKFGTSTVTRDELTR
jgi:rfaE bifunctional protein kinase chain/domain